MCRAFPCGRKEFCRWIPGELNKLFQRQTDRVRGDIHCGTRNQVSSDVEIWGPEEKSRSQRWLRHADLLVAVALRCRV